MSCASEIFTAKPRYSGCVLKSEFFNMVALYVRITRSFTERYLPPPTASVFVPPPRVDACRLRGFFDDVTKWHS